MSSKITNYQELKKQLAIVDNTITIKKDLSNTIKELITNCYGNLPINIEQAKTGPGDGENEKVVIQGVSNFLNRTNLEIVASFYLDDKKEVQALIKYTLVGDSRTTTSWNFSSSFQKLPKVNGFQNTLNPKPTSPLDELILTNSFFIVTTVAQKSIALNVALVYGINFVGKMKPTNVLGILENTIGNNQLLTVSGSITLPKATEKTVALTALQYPWDLEKPVPGINLKVDLSINLNMDSMTFNQASFLIYSPISLDWQIKNPTFEPLTAYAGIIEIPSAKIKANISGIMKPGETQMLLRGDFKGVTIKNIASMVDISGTNNLVDSLPEEIKKAGDNLGKLELQSTAILLALNGNKINVLGTYFTIGIPELNWSIWDNHFSVDSISCGFSIRKPFTKPNVSVSVFGQIEIENVKVSVAANTLDGFTVYAKTIDKLTIPLKQLVKTYGPSIPVPSDLTIDKLQLGVSPRNWYSFALAMAGKPNAWSIPMGPTGFTVSDVVMNFIYPSSGSISGSVGGNIALGDIATLSVTYDIPGDITLRSTLPDVKLSQLTNLLTNQALSIPDAFDLHFINNTLLFQKQSNNYNFQLATDLENFGLLALQIQKVNTAWGVAFGLDMTHGIPSTLPGLSYLSSFENMFKMDKFMLVVSSFDAPSFNFPDTANFSNPNLGTKNIQLPAQASTLVAGLNVYGEWTIDTTNKNQKLLQKFLGTNPTLGITLQVSKVPSDNSRLFVSYNTKIQGHPLSCTFGGQIVSGELGLFLAGSMTIDIQDQPQTFDVIMLFVTNGAFLSATMKGKTAIDFEVFKLSNLALEIGISFEGIPSLGVAGTIDVSTFESSIAVFFDSTNPAKSLVAGAVSDLHLGDVLDAFTGNVIPSDIDKVLNTIAVTGTHSFSISGALSKDLDNLKLDSVAAECLSKGGLTIPTSQTQVLLVVNTPGAIWYLTDMTKMRHYAFVKSGNSITVSTEAQFYCAPQATNIGSIPFSQGFYINGAIEFLGFNASMTVDIDTNKGISVDAQMDPIVIGDKALFSITAANNNGGPKVSLSTYNNPAQPIKEFIPPHFYINGAIKILGISKHAFVSITTSGASFDIGGDIFPVLVKGDLNGTFNGITDLKVGGQLNVGIGDIDLGPLGTFKIETGAETDTDIYVNSSDIGADFEVKFSLAGESLSLGKIQLDIKTQTIEDLPKVLFNAVKAFLIDLFTDPKKWAEYAKKALDWTADKIEGVLKDTFKLGEEAIKGIVAGLSSVCAMTQALGAL
ncbi:hypothetical protein [uncultured Algibacter sp.]|uniref:hypothetical protein n=1 Tax=uncultured Algibacter sp. TaxID=298659 RepID=UPI0032171287